jgi:hypothetical protein
MRNNNSNASVILSHLKTLEDDIGFSKMWRHYYPSYGTKLEEAYGHHVHVFFEQLQVQDGATYVRLLSSANQ